MDTNLGLIGKAFGGATLTRGRASIATDTPGRPPREPGLRAGTGLGSAAVQGAAPGPGATQAARQASSATVNLSDEELAIVRQLAAIDREVRAHEQAHAAVGGRYAGSPSYTFARGPDGRQYAVAGQVPIDLSPVEGDPEATIDKARIVRRAALAPAQPSSQDRSIAARATALEQQAQVELNAELAEEREAQLAERAGDSATPQIDNEIQEILRSYRPIDTQA